MMLIQSLLKWLMETSSFIILWYSWNCCSVVKLINNHLWRWRRSHSHWTSLMHIVRLGHILLTIYNISFIKLLIGLINNLICLLCAQIKTLEWLISPIIIGIIIWNTLSTCIAIVKCTCAICLHIHGLVNWWMNTSSGDRLKLFLFASILQIIQCVFDIK